MGLQSTLWARKTTIFLEISQWKIARKESALEEVALEDLAKVCCWKSTKSHAKGFRAAYADKAPFDDRVRSTFLVSCRINYPLLSASQIPTAFLFQVSGSDSQAAVHSSSIRRLVFFVELYFMWMWNDTMTKASRTGTQIPEWLAAPHFPQHKQTIHSVMPWYWNCRGAGGRRENICTREKQGLLNKQNIFLLFLRWVKVCVTPGSKWLRKTLNCVAVA